VTTQDPKRMRALDVPSKAERVRRYQQEAVGQAMQVIASMGLSSFDDLTPHMLRRRVSDGQIKSYADIFQHLAPRELLDQPPPAWARDWELADPDLFTP
jgi:hypothetical protein